MNTEAKTFTIISSFKVADIAPTDITEASLNLLKDLGMTYRDNRLKEHIFNVQDVLEYFADENKGEDITDEIIAELEALAAALDEVDACYVRVIYQ